MVEVQRQSHWRDGEEPIAAVEWAVAAKKEWGMLHQLPPSSEFVDAYDAELQLSEADAELEAGGSFLLKGHLERDGTIIIGLWYGETLLRRAHIGGVHQEPDNGPVYYVPHVHFPTTVFRVIEGRRARSRIYSRSVPDFSSLWDAMRAFAAEINLTGDPTEQQRRLPGGQL